MLNRSEIVRGLELSGSIRANWQEGGEHGSAAGHQFPAIVQLEGHLHGAHVLRIDGEAAYDSMAAGGPGREPLGDINGDGYLDLVLGAPNSSAGGAYAGRTYVVYGTADGFSAFDAADGASDGVARLEDLGSLGVTIDGAAAYDFSGYSASAAGDLNGDGIGDLLTTGTDGIDPGSVYLVFGSTGLASSETLADIDGPNGYAFFGAAGDTLGSTLATMGDINGDGELDFVIGATHQSHNAMNAGGAYVVFGGAANLAAMDALDGTSDGHIDLSLAADGTHAFNVSGEAANDYAGFHVAFAGDVNGDGYDDLMVGAHFKNGVNGSHSGTTYIVYGKASGFAPDFDLSGIDGTNGFRILGEAALDRSGRALASADVNGDGYRDLIVGAPTASAEDTDAGAAYVIFGQAGGFNSDIDLSDIDGTNGFKIVGAGAYAQLGGSLAGADINGDGFDDIVVGAFGADGYTGATYVIFGKQTGFGASVDVSLLDGSNGFTIAGATGAYSVAGIGVSAGDLDGDGFAEVLVAAGSSYEGLYSGSEYIVYGAAPRGSVHRVGTDASQTLAGGARHDTLKGMGGDDQLHGNGGGDTLIGGLGDDVFVYRDASDSTGTHYDTIKQANFAHDRFVVHQHIDTVDDTIGSGTLGNASFDADLANAADAAHLGAHHAVLFTPDGGGHAGQTFLVIDVNGTAGYQTGEDIVVRLAHASHLGALNADSFI